jgi:hypothetical protein
MEGKALSEEMTIEQRMKEEERITEKIDAKGDKWRKLYFGGGAHFSNWLDQCKEIYGEENLEIEEASSTGFKCFEESGEKLYRIWARM